jgi:quercetin dioxygenase-like cupin family protein
MPKTVSASMKTLAALTRNLPHLADMLSAEDEGIHFESQSGHIEVDLIYKNDHIAVINAVMSKGAISLLHVHKEIEILHVYEGKILVEKNNKKDRPTVKQFETISIPKDTPHRVTCLEEARIMAILMPADEEFSNACERME